MPHYLRFLRKLRAYDCNAEMPTTRVARVACMQRAIVQNFNAKRLKRGQPSFNRFN